MTIKTKTTLQNIFGILLLFLSLPMFEEGGKGILGALFMIAGALICIPKTREFIEQKYNFHFSRPLKYFAVIFSLLCIGIFSKPANPSTSEESTATTAINSQQDNSVNLLIDTSTVYKAQTLQNVELAEGSVSRTTVSTTSNSGGTVKSEKLIKKSYNNSTSKQVEKKQPKKTKRSSYGNSNATGRSGYIRGPRGGCYYINSSGRKVYVDHSYCN